MQLLRPHPRHTERIWGQHLLICVLTYLMHDPDLLSSYKFLLSSLPKVTQLCPTLCDPMDYTVRGLLQARILEWVAFPFSRGCSQPRDRTQVSLIVGGFFTSWATFFPTRCYKNSEIRMNPYFNNVAWFLNFLSTPLLSLLYSYWRNLKSEKCMCESNIWQGLP